MCRKMEFNPPSNSPLPLKLGKENNTNIKLIRIYHSLSFLLWFIALY